jgi:hypothetical protein
VGRKGSQVHLPSNNAFWQADRERLALAISEKKLALTKQGFNYRNNSVDFSAGANISWGWKGVMSA